MQTKRTRKIASDQGFTIFEVALAMAVTLVAVVGLIQTITIGAELLDVSHKQTVAMQIIRNEIDNVHLQSWSLFPTSGFPKTYTVTIKDDGSGFTSGSSSSKPMFALNSFASNVPNTALLAAAKGFTVTLDISQPKGTSAPNSNILQLKYKVTWTAGNRHKTYSRTGTTYYGRYGLNTYYQK